MIHSIITLAEATSPGLNLYSNIHQSTDGDKNEKFHDDYVIAQKKS
jgi:hypothetical protein